MGGEREHIRVSKFIQGGRGSYAMAVRLNYMLR
jgi:hypothetical protein